MAPPRRISRDSIVAAALAIVDEEGLDALVVRNIAKRLGVQSGALYHHITDMDDIKAEVVWEATKVVIGLPQGEMPWQEAAKLHVTAFRDALLRHPNVLPLLVGATGQRIWVRRLYTGFGKYLETFLANLAGDGITGANALTVLEALESFTIGAATVATLNGDETFMEASAALDPGSRLARTMAKAPVRPDRRFETNLQSLLDGLTQNLSRSSAETPVPIGPRNGSRR